MSIYYSDTFAIYAWDIKCKNTDNFYECSDEILRNLGKMYASGGEFTENIDKAAGNGTAEFVANAIKAYCK